MKGQAYELFIKLSYCVHSVPVCKGDKVFDGVL